MLDAVRMAADDDAVIEGWAVPFDGHLAGGKDSYGTFFDAHTNYALDWYPSRPAIYQHGLDADTALVPVGAVSSLAVRETGGPNNKGGVWMRTQLDRQHRYFNEIRQMVQDGQLYLSSGSVEHLVKIDQRSGHVDQWPIIEVSLTPTPANLFADIPEHSFRAAVDTALPDDLADDAVITHTPKRDDSARSAQIHTAMQGVSATQFLGVLDSLGVFDEHGALRAEVGDAADTDDDEVGSDERSFEDICADLDALLNPMYATAYTRRLNTFPTHVLVKRCDYSGDYGGGYSLDDDDESVTFWDIPYTLGADQEPVLGTPVQVQRNETYTPVARSFDAPLSFETQQLLNHLAAFTASTEDYGERRYREGREISGMNLQTMGDAIDGMQGHLDKMRELHGRASARKEEAARAALVADPEYRRALMEMLAF